MLNGTEQFVAAQRSMLETAQNVSLKAIEGASKLFDLNVQAARTAVADTTEQVKSMLEMDVTRLNAKSFAMPQPSTEKVTAYAKQVYEIVASTNSDIANLLQKHLEQAQELAVETMDKVAKTAPAGSETLFAAAKNSFGMARNAYDQAVTASRQVVEMAEQNVAAAAKAGSRAASKAVSDAAAPAIVTAA